MAKGRAGQGSSNADIELGMTSGKYSTGVKAVETRRLGQEIYSRVLRLMQQSTEQVFKVFKFL